MEFSSQQKQVRQMGLKNPSCSLLTFAQLRRLDHVTAVADSFHLSVSPVSASPAPKIHVAQLLSWMLNCNLYFNNSLTCSLLL